MESRECVRIQKNTTSLTGHQLSEGRLKYDGLVRGSKKKPLYSHSLEFLFESVEFVKESVVLDLHGGAGHEPGRDELAYDHNMLRAERRRIQCRQRHCDP